MKGVSLDVERAPRHACVVRRDRLTLLHPRAFDLDRREVGTARIVIPAGRLKGRAAAPGALDEASPCPRVTVQRIFDQYHDMSIKNGITETRPKASTGRLFGIVAVFALIDPPIGGIVLSACLAFLAATPQLMAYRWAVAGYTFLIGTLCGTTFGLPIAYVIGTLPAAGVGLVVAMWDRRKGVISWRIAIGAALVPSVFVALRAGDIVGADEGTRIWQITMLLAHLAAAVACGWLARAIVD